MNPQDGQQGNLAHSLFETFLHASQCQEVLTSFQALCSHLGLEQTGQLHFYQKLKSCLNYWSAKALWSKLDKKAGHSDYDQGRACANTKCLIVGAGPCGLRTAIELAFLGARVVLVEKRDSFSRNNVLHLWPFTIQDLRALGAKKFYGRFCTGSLDHISIRQLQLILLKVALLLGVEIHISVAFKGLLPPAVKRSKHAGGGWQALLHPSSSPMSQYEFDVLISAGGGKFVPEGFKRKETRGKLAIGITTNFVNRHSRAEVEVAEISGVARIYNQQFFQNLYNKTGIDLENIVYYKDDTHYFVMTAKKHSLLKKGVIRQDKPDTESLLSPKNVNQEALLSYAKEAASFSTNYQLPDMQFALNHRGSPDVDVFDFTCMTRSENAALVREHNGTKLLIGLVGDCLVEPFWPLGTGVGRGFLASLDAAWMVKRWAAETALLDVLAERESIYQQLSQTSPDNTNKNISQYSINPTTRYPNINLQAIKASQVRDLHVMGIGEMNRRQSNSRVSLDSVCPDSGRSCEELLSWCQANTAGYSGVTVTDFTHSWKNGLALCALIHHFRPELLDFDSLDHYDSIGNNRLALDLAEQELGIPPVLSSAEIASVSEPHQLGLITYLSQFHEAFKPSPELEKSTMKLLTPRATKGALLFLSKLQKSLSLTRKRTQEWTERDAQTKKTKQDAALDLSMKVDSSGVDLEQTATDTLGSRKSSPLSPVGSSDACYFCGKQVYILERVSAEGHFFHRGCFKCHQCGTTLRLGDFAFDEDDGRFYCMLHYPCPLMAAVPGDGPPSPSHMDSSRLHTLSDTGGLHLAAKHRMETDSEAGPAHENPASLSKPLAKRKPAELKEGAREGAFPARGNRGSNATATPRPLDWPPTVPEKNLGSRVPKGLSHTLTLEEGGDKGKACPEETGVGSGSEGEERPLKHRNPATDLQGSGADPPAWGEVPGTHGLTLQKETEEAGDPPQRKKIQLSSLEKLKLSMLSLTSEADIPVCTEPLSGKAKAQGAPERGQVCLVDPCFAEEAEDSQETDSESEEEEQEKEEGSPDLGYSAENCLLNLDVAEKYPTWKRTLTRRAREAQMKRFCKAQLIQRRLAEIEETFHDLEQQGTKLEKSLREEGGTQSELKMQWMNQLLHLVQKKNNLMSEESDLMIVVQELKLEEQQSQLDKKLRRYLNMDGPLKTLQDRLAEKAILAQLLDVVDRRNTLIHVLEEKRLSELSECGQGAAARLNQSPSV
uniref:Molecule interacting with CasL protein 1 n=1 Tax=Sphenodon punctatus TaxID=8508 RepID=A0A8D0H3I5_SPHPU